MIEARQLLLGPRAAERTGRRFAAASSALVAALALLCVLAPASPGAALEQKLTAPGALFGYSAAIDGDTLVVGDPLDRAGVGAVYVFQRSDGSWANTAKLTASDGSEGDLLGVSVAIDGDTIVAGAKGDGVDHNATHQGSVYTFTRTGVPQRTETAKLKDDQGAVRAELGASVAIDGDTIVAGAPGKSVGTHAIQGAVLTFTRTGEPARTQTATMTASDGAASDQLGYSVAIDGDAIVAGAPIADVGAHDAQGAAYTFARAGGAARTETGKLTASSGAEKAELGVAVAIDGDTIVAGAPLKPSAPSRRAPSTPLRAPARWPARRRRR